MVQEAAKLTRGDLKARVRVLGDTEVVLQVNDRDTTVLRAIRSHLCPKLHKFRASVYQYELQIRIRLREYRIDHRMKVLGRSLVEGHDETERGLDGEIGPRLTLTRKLGLPRLVRVKPLVVGAVHPRVDGKPICVKAHILAPRAADRVVEPVIAAFYKTDERRHGTPTKLFMQPIHSNKDAKPARAMSPDGLKGMN